MNAPLSCRRTLVAWLVPIALAATPAAAQQPDVNAMVKWMSAAVIHYRYVGEYSDQSAINGSPVGEGQVGGLSAKVSDRIEFELDWNQTEMKVVGAPVVKNFPTKVELLPETRCPDPQVEGVFEFATLTSITAPSPGTPRIALALKRDYVGGTVAYMGEGKCGTSRFAAGSETSSKDVDLVNGMMMVEMPGSPPKTPDGKSLMQKDNDGWAWTITPTIK
jgi:hypothetical protein